MAKSIVECLEQYFLEHEKFIEIEANMVVFLMLQIIITRILPFEFCLHIQIVRI